MALGDYMKGVPKPSTSYSSLVNSPVKSSGTPLIAPKAPTQSSYSAVPSRAIAPVANYTPWRAPVQAPAQQSQQISGGYGGGAGAAGNGGGGMAASTYRPPRTYDSFTDQEAATDSTFTDQKSAYANALKKFIEDNDRQKGILETDAGIAQKGIERNKTNGLTGLSEDFASRGLSNSGMFRGELDNASDQYGKQKEQVTMGLKNGTDDLGFRRAKYEQENGENGTNIQAARREAFARLAASQGLT